MYVGFSNFTQRSPSFPSLRIFSRDARALLTPAEKFDPTYREAKVPKFLKILKAAPDVRPIRQRL